MIGSRATYSGSSYVDEVAVGSNAAMTLRPSNLAHTLNNGIGRSQPAGALFDALIDALRIYKGG